MTQYVAERRLLYSLKDSAVKQPFTIKIAIPYLVKQEMVNFPLDELGCYGCHIEIDGLNEKWGDRYGVDSMQAINLASNIESIVRWLQKRYDIYWSTGEPYFESDGD